MYASVTCNFMKCWVYVCVCVCGFVWLCKCAPLLLVCDNLKQTSIKKLKVKVTLVQALRHCTGRTAHRGSRGIALPFHDHGTRRGWGVSVTPRPLFTPGKTPVPIAQEDGWAPGPVWQGAENLAPHRDSIPARSQSLYRLSYPAHKQALAIRSPCLASLTTLIDWHLRMMIWNYADVWAYLNVLCW